MKGQKSLQLRPTPFVQKSSSNRGRKQNGIYSFNRREIKLVSRRTNANALGKERLNKNCIWIPEVCWVPANHVIITDKLVTFLPEDNFSYLHSHFRDCSDNQKRLLHRKGFYPYTYFDYRGKFSEAFFTTVELLKKFSTAGISKHESRRME